MPAFCIYPFVTRWSQSRWVKPSAFRFVRSTHLLSMTFTFFGQWTNSRVIFRQCTHFSLPGLNPILQHGVHGFPVWRISITSISSACRQKNVVPWSHPHLLLDRVHWSFSVSRHLLLDLHLRSFSPTVKTVWLCVFFLPFFCDHLFYSYDLQVHSSLWTGGNSFRLEVNINLSQGNKISSHFYIKMNVWFFFNSKWCMVWWWPE